MSHSRLRRFIFAVLVLSALPGAARATAPGVLTYQGRLKQTGLPAAGGHSVEISLCDALTGGTCYSTGIQSVNVSNGLFRTTFTVPSGVSLELGAWYLEIGVDGSAFTPREMLAAAPYAVYASSAATLIPNSGATNVVIASSVSVAGNLIVGPAGHLHLSGSAPALGADCGAGATLAAGSDMAGRIVLGAAPATTCTLTFNTPWSSTAYLCHFINESQPQPLRTSAFTTTDVTVTSDGVTALTASNMISYICLGF